MLLKKVFVACLAATTTGLIGTAALADTLGNEAKVSAFIGAGVTFGGDKLAEVYYTNGDKSSLTAGGLLDLRAGVDYRFANSPISIQGSVGYHVNDTNADNGSLRFSRVPVELLAHWHITEAWKIGAGVRQSTGTKLSSSGAANNIPDTKFDSSLAPVLEGEYLFNPQFGLKLRYVNEEYEVKNTTSGFKIDGSHVGLIAVYYFQ